MSPRITFDEVSSQQDIINNKSFRNKFGLSFANNITDNSLKTTSENFCNNLINHRATRNSLKSFTKEVLGALGIKAIAVVLIGEKKTSLSKKSKTTSKVSYLTMCKKEFFSF